MATSVTLTAAAEVFAQALRAAWAPTKLGIPASVAPATASDGQGWIVTARVSGVANGALTAWFEREGMLACATKLLALETPAADDVVGPVLMGLVAHAISVFETHPGLAGLIVAEPVVQSGPAPKGAQVVEASWPDGAVCRFGGLAELSSPAATDNASLAADGRLDAVMDVDLPLVVRFGRTVLPLRAVADLSPGSVVDMGRSPDDPVELLVGERLIARGEVVIVGGNYGVRITELTNGRRTADLENRS
ncbi:MAG: FliM/FliN family flagellar motor switch protein [Acidobacteriota bacterium]